jgi:hypothetical protein
MKFTITPMEDMDETRVTLTDQHQKKIGSVCRRLRGQKTHVGSKEGPHHKTKRYAQTVTADSVQRPFCFTNPPFKGLIFKTEEMA